MKTKTVSSNNFAHYWYWNKQVKVVKQKLKLQKKPSDKRTKWVETTVEQYNENPYITVSSTKFSLFTVIVNNKNNSKTNNKQQKEKTYRGEMLVEPTNNNNNNKQRQQHKQQQQHPARV